MTPAPIIDANARIRRDTGPQGARDLLARMDGLGIERALVAGGGYITPERLARHVEHGGGCDVDIDHGILLEQCTVDRRRLLPVYIANPRRSDDPYPARGREFVALKIAPVLHGVALLDPHVLALVHAAMAHGHPIYLHCLHRDGFRVADLVALAGRFPSARFVLEHAGVGNCDGHAVEQIEPMPNIWLETSGGFTSVIQAACSRLGIGRVMFGSEHPLQDPHAELEKLRCLALDRQDLERVLGRNVAELIGLEARHV